MSPRPIVLFVTNPDPACGVYQFGELVAEALSRATAFDYRRVACTGPLDLWRAWRELDPVAAIYNHTSLTMPWLSRAVLLPLRGVHLGLVHEVSQALANGLTGVSFDGYIAADPTLVLNNPLVFKTGRLVPEWPQPAAPTGRPVIGSFGFGLKGKGFEQLIARVQQEFDDALIRLHIPFAHFGDQDGAAARRIADACQRVVTKPGLELQISHQFLSRSQLLDFLSGNHLNAFLYDDMPGRGISSVLDFALAVGRPVALSASCMFRHVLSLEPRVCVEQSSLVELLAAGDTVGPRLRREWSAANLAWDYDRIVVASLARAARPLRDLLDRARGAVRAGRTGRGHDWVPQTNLDDAFRVLPRATPYAPVEWPGGALNRALDDEARQLLQGAERALAHAAPAIYARKLPRANVQQAYVFDTVLRLLPQGPAPVLGVGTHEDPVVAALRCQGARVDELDPVLNYDLATFLTRPSVREGSYQVVFATSVVEHVADDEAFVAGIARLLAPGGHAVLTCDFLEGYRKGQAIPGSNHRFYTRHDLLERLLPAMQGCDIVGVPRWHESPPDFDWAGCRYGFAGVVVRRRPAAARA